jgi:cytochrome P450/NADPH-cytochrome P450 reductase
MAMMQMSFKPERMLGDNFKESAECSVEGKLSSPQGMFGAKILQPFGTGVRAYIGRAFAWQEALMVMAMLLQNFSFQLDDPSYNLRIKQTLTIKPLGLKMRSTLRHGMNATDLERFLHGSPIYHTALAPSIPERRKYRLQNQFPVQAHQAVRPR